MFINKIRKEQLERLFPDIIEGIDFYEWHEVFPTVTGYEPCLPHSFEEAEQYADSYRSDDRIIALEMAKYPGFHDQMIDIIYMIMDLNKKSEMWELYADEEYPGISFAYALALSNIKYLDLYTTFLSSVKPDFQIIYLPYDIVNLIKKWGWNSETYHLLFTYWFSNDKDKAGALKYLLYTGFTIDLKEEDAAGSITFIQTLELFIHKSGYSQDELRDKYQKLFEELTEDFIFPDHQEKSEVLKNRYHEVVEKLLHGEAVSELPEETNTATIDIFQQYKDEDFAEI